MIEIERQKEKEKFKSDPTELSLDTIDSSLVYRLQSIVNIEIELKLHFLRFTLVTFAH